MRAARNQAAFRSLNEQLERLGDGSESRHETDRATFACECADVSCIEQMELTLAEYELVRSDPNRFAVVPGHVYHDVEDVVEERDGFTVVAKTGRGAELAVASDPRRADV